MREHLKGYEEVPAVSTLASGEFRARINDSRIEYKLTYRGLEGDVTQAHIHLGQERVNGMISAFLCSNHADRAGGHAALRRPARDGTSPARSARPT